jgi:uncharacterized protein (UPF0276 family)
LGIGLAYQASLRGFIEECSERFDFLEVVPDILWTDLGPGRQPRFVEEPEGLAFVAGVRERMPVIAHSIGLSIASAHRFDREHVDQIARWHERFDFPWHSDHLTYNVAEHLGGEGEVNVGFNMPVPLERETLDLVVPRAREVRARIPVPFLLENNVDYLQLPEPEMDEADFLNALARASGCWLLLDLHNVYVNARNHGFDPRALLERVDLERVAELHVAGGMEHDGFYLDSHSGAMPEPVRELLDWTLARCPNVGGVTFEMAGSWLAVMGEAGLGAELEHMREAWARHQPPPEVPGR